MKFALKITTLSLLLAVSVCAQKIYPLRAGSLVYDVSSVTATSETTGYPVSSIIDGDRIGHRCAAPTNRSPCFGNNGGWMSVYGVSYPQNARIDFAHPHSIGGAVLSLFQDNNITIRIEPWLGLQVGNNYSLEEARLEVCTNCTIGDHVGDNWVEVSHFDENYDVIKSLSWYPIVGTAIRLVVDKQPIIGQVRVIEFEPMSVVPLYQPWATPSTAYGPQYQAYGALGVDRDGNHWANYGGWNDKTPGDFPDWLRVNYSQPCMASQVVVTTLKDDYNSGSVVTDAMTFTAFGITDFEVQTSLTEDDEDFVTVTGGHITGNNKVRRTINFSPVSAQYVRVLVHDSVGHDFSRIVDLKVTCE